MRTRLLGMVATGAVGLALASPASGQGLAREIEGIDDGWASLEVDVRPGVEVCDRGIRWIGEDGETRGRWHGHGEGEEVCEPGPLQLDFHVLNGRVQAIEAGRIAPRARARALGPRPPVDVSEYLVGLAYRGASDEAAEAGLFLSRLPRGADPTAGILRVAGDRSLSTEVRKAGLFWAGQMATEVVVEPLRAVAVEDESEQEVREAAVFALSQHQGADATPVLMELALEAPHAGTRRSALFWLAQRDDPAVAKFFADVILGRRGG